MSSAEKTDSGVSFVVAGVEGFTHHLGANIRAHVGVCCKIRAPIAAAPQYAGVHTQSPSSLAPSLCVDRRARQRNGDASALGKAVHVSEIGEVLPGGVSRYVGFAAAMLTASSSDMGDHSSARGRGETLVIDRQWIQKQVQREHARHKLVKRTWKVRNMGATHDDGQDKCMWRFRLGRLCAS